jgi:hypothetical protein
MLLSLDEIVSKIVKKSLPTQYQIQTPLTITGYEFTRILSLFKEEDALFIFLNTLSINPDIQIRICGSLIKLGCSARLLHVFFGGYIFHDRRLTSQIEWIKLFFDQIVFEQEEILYLLVHLSWRSRRDFLLNYRFENESLIKIANDYALLKQLSYNAIELIYHFLNPVRRWQKPQTPLLDMYYFSYRAGHVLGLDKYVLSTIGGEKTSFYTEFGMASVSLQLLVNHLESFRQKNPSYVADTIYYAMKGSWQLMKFFDYLYISEAPDYFHEDYINGKLVYLSAGWQDHTVGLAFLGNYLAICNRGEDKDPNFGAAIYRIKNREEITANFFARLVLNTSITSQRFHDILSTILDFDNPIVTFRSIPHKHDTCTFVNPKSIIEPLIVLVRSGGNASEERVQAIAQEEYSRKKYKCFTQFMRNKEIDELIKNMFYAQEPDLILFYANLVKKIIREHHGKDRFFIKDEKEIIRAVDLFHRVPDRILIHIKEDKSFIKLMDDIIKKHARLVGEAEREESRLYLTSYNTYSKHRVTINSKGYICSIDNRETPKMPYNITTARKLIAVTC